MLEMAVDARKVFQRNLNMYMNIHGVDQSYIVMRLGITASTVSDWVNGKKYPRVDAMQRLADLFGIAMSDLTADRSIQRPESISTRIKEGLALRNMNQTDLAEKTGIGKSSISTYISGDSEPRQQNIAKIAIALDVSPAWLMGLDVPIDERTLNMKIDIDRDKHDWATQLLSAYCAAQSITQQNICKLLEIPFVAPPEAITNDYSSVGLDAESIDDIRHRLDEVLVRHRGGSQKNRNA